MSMMKKLLVGTLMGSVAVSRGDSPDEVKANLNRSVGFPYRLYAVREPLPYTGREVRIKVRIRKL